MAQREVQIYSGYEAFFSEKMHAIPGVGPSHSRKSSCQFLQRTILSLHIITSLNAKILTTVNTFCIVEGIVLFIEL